MSNTDSGMKIAVPGQSRGDDPARQGHAYYPWWLDNLAEDATGEGAFMQGAAFGADAVRTLVTFARTVYEFQQFRYAGPFGDDGFLEDYSTRIDGEPATTIVTVSRNAAGQAQHIVVNHRPRSAVLRLAEICRRRFADEPLAPLFADGRAAMSINAAAATYMRSGEEDGGFSDYYPKWLDNLADDVTLQGAAMNGTARGAEKVRSIIVHARTLYEHQVFTYTGPYGSDGFLEQYTTPIQGEPTGVVVAVSLNQVGRAQHIAVLHRPRSSMLLFSRLMGAKFAGTPIAEHFITSDE